MLINKYIMHCVIFDFDNTLTTFNVSVKKDMLTGNENVFTNVVTSNNFKQFLQILRNKNIKIYILSYGYHHIIVNYLKKFNLYHYFDDIYTPSSYGLKDGYSYSEQANGKNLFIERITRNIKNNNILLIDDDRINIAWATEVGYNVVKIDPRFGITDNDFNYMCDIINTK